jgi:hypothetical protein
MPSSVYVEKIGNQFRITADADSLPEAQSLINLLLTQKSPEAFKPEPPPLSPEAEALFNRADATEVD